MTVMSKIAACCAALVTVSGVAHAAPVTFSKLTGVTGNPAAANTAVFKADLASSGLASFTSLAISDSGVIGASAPGEFSGFDLDAVIISTVDCATAACVAGLTSDVVFDYSNAIFMGGTQSAPADPKLYGTDVSGNNVDNATATLGAFDGFSSTLTPDGFISLGVNGSIGFNFAAAISTSAPLFLYIGEVGDNGELAAGGIEIFVDPIPDVPVPAALPLFILGMGALRMKMKKRAKA